MTHSGNKKGHGALAHVVGQAPAFKPFRDRHVRTRGIKCRECGAEIGKPCLTRAGKPSNPHRARRADVLRAEREAAA